MGIKFQPSSSLYSYQQKPLFLLCLQQKLTSKQKKQGKEKKWPYSQQHPMLMLKFYGNVGWGHTIMVQTLTNLPKYILHRIIRTHISEDYKYEIIITWQFTKQKK